MTTYPTSHPSHPNAVPSPTAAAGRAASGPIRDLTGPVGRRRGRRLWEGLRAIAYGVDAGALVRHGRQVPADHPARRRSADGHR